MAYVYPDFTGPSATLQQPGAPGSAGPPLTSLKPPTPPQCQHPNSHPDQPALSSSSAAQQHQQRVATAGNRSASLPFNLQMGLSQSKPAPTAAPTSWAPPPSTPAKLSTTVSNGLKRTFARRRKNSEDASKLFAGRGKEQPDAKLRAGVSSPSLATDKPPPMSAAQRSTPPRIETRPHNVGGAMLKFRGVRLISPQPSHSIIRSPLQCPPALPKKDTPPPPATPPSHVHVHSEPPAAGSRSSVMTNITEITSAVNFITLMDEQQAKSEGDVESAKGSDKPETTKEIWRKSDSTNSHHTIRPPVAGAPSRSSRPVSWADSLQSTHTLMPQSNKRRSALIGDADFGMAEEDDEDGSMSSHSHAAAANTSPTASTRSLHRRSMSLNLGNSTPQPQSIPAFDMRYASHSVSEGVPPFSAVLAPRGGPAAVTPTPPAPQPQPAASNLRGRLAAWSAAAGNTYITPSPPPHPQAFLQPQPPASVPQNRTPSPATAARAQLHPPPSSSPSSFRQTAISIGVGSAAAGIARRTVDKIGRKWAQGMGISASSSGSGGGGGGWSSSSSASMTDPASLSGASHSHLGEVLVRTSSNLSMATQNTSSFFSPSHHARSGAGSSHKRTPASGAGSVSSASMASGSNSDSDFFAPSGPLLGVRLRGALRGNSKSGGVVFGRNLGAGVRDTGVWVGVGSGVGVGGSVGGKRRAGLAGVFEERVLAAVVVRCAQHLVLWGVEEEGLFRVPGRSAHVSKLRAEFDSGADYDMEACSPGDLDPHAVASVFKAYLRELPEPILTQKLQPLFDEAITKEASKNAADSSSSAATNTSTARPRGAQGLPSNPKSGFTAGLRKPPSLSTLAMPSFTGIPPASPALVSSIKALVARLPAENRDLLLTVVDLIRETARRSKETKMPLSNLLVVFCPSLGMTPPLLKTLCEVGGGWAGEGPGVIDIRRQEADGDDASASSEDARSRLDDEADSVASSRPSLDGPSSDYHGSAEGSITRDAVPRVLRADFAREVPTVYLDTRSHMSAGSSVPSLLQQDSGSIASSGGGGGSSGYAYGAPLSGSSPPPLSSSSESVVTPTSSGNPSFTDLQFGGAAAMGGGKDAEAQPLGMQHAHHNGSGPLIFDALELHQHAHGKPGPLATPVPVPFPVHAPPTPSSATKRRSIPMLSLPVVTPLSPSAQPSPSPHSEPRTLRGKKPSLKLLFSKRSASSLNGARGLGLGVISPPVLLTHQGSPRSGSGSDSGSSSVSTPLSAVTAPTGAGSASASSAQLPPVLDTPIERAEFGMELGFELSPPPTATPSDMHSDAGGAGSARASPRPRVVGSPYGIREEREEGKTQGTATQPLALGGARRTIKPGESHIRPQASSSNLSLASSHHLSLFEDDESDEGMEGWTQSVLLAADVDGKWVVQKTGGGTA